MVRLETLGALVLVDPARPGFPTQRRKLALLALLATAGERGMSRDRLLALLWPESDQDHARHSLEQLLYLVRKQLGDVFSGSDPIRLNPIAIESDLAAFEEALETRRDRDAVALYRGPFLDGFHLGAGADFNGWVEDERARLAGAYASAVERLATEAWERRDPEGSSRWWRRLTALDRFSARYALGLFRSLAAAGGRAEALRLAASYEALLDDELGLPLDPSVRALLDELRSPERSVVGPPARMGWSQAEQTAATPAASPNDVPMRTAARPAESPRFRPLIAAGTAAVLFAAGWSVREAIGSGRGPAADDVALGPWSVSGDAARTYLADTIPALLAPWFISESGSEAHARRGRGAVLLGEAVVAGPDRIELNARLMGSAGGGQAGLRASVAGPADSLSALVERLGARLRARLAGESARRAQSVGTRSPEALGAFLEGRARRRDGLEDLARADYAEALQHDSTFALAALELALSTARVFQWSILTADTAYGARGLSLSGEITALSDHDLWERAMEVAWRERAQLGPEDRALLDALRVDATEAPFARDVLAAWEQAVRAAPDRAESHYWLGYVLLHQGLAMGLGDSRARAQASFRHALELEAAPLGALVGLIEIAAYADDRDALPGLRKRYLARSPRGSEADYVRWLVAAASGDQRELRRIRARFATLDLATLARIQRTSQQSGIALEDAERADSVILSRTHERQQRQVALYRATFLQLNRGRPAEALRLMRSKRDVDPGPELGQGYALRYALMWEGDVAAGEAAAQALALGPERAPLVAVLSSPPLWRLWRGDTIGAAASIARLRKIAEPHSIMLDALLADVVGRPDASIMRARLDSLALRGCCDQPHFVNLVSARLHERAGDIPAALAAVRRGRWFFPAEYLSTYLREEGRLATLTADTAGAVRAYRHYLTLRADPEPTARAAAEDVRADLARLER